MTMRHVHHTFDFMKCEQGPESSFFTKEEYEEKCKKKTNKYLGAPILIMKNGSKAKSRRNVTFRILAMDCHNKDCDCLRGAPEDTPEPTPREYATTATSPGGTGATEEQQEHQRQQQQQVQQQREQQEQQQREWYQQQQQHQQQQQQMYYAQQQQY